MNTTKYLDPKRTYKRPSTARADEFTATLEQNAAGRWMTRINGGMPFPSTNVEIYLWALIAQCNEEQGHGA